VLPASLMATFGAALSASDGERLTWSGGSRIHEIVVARPSIDEAQVIPVLVDSSEQAGERREAATTAPRVIRQATPRVRWPRVAASGRVTSRSETTTSGEPEAVDLRLVGRLVHRLLEARVAEPGDENERQGLAQRIQGLLRADERAATADVAALVARVAETFTRARRNAELTAALASGTAELETPFSMVDRDLGCIVRGVIDCLVTRPDGSMVVIEVKTGRSRPQDRAQLEAYVAFARALRPGADATGLLVYA
jgi:ATP-dependent exoDNAse (exonuclease V) beta subunit